MEILLWVLACYVIADFITGLVHWAEDTLLEPGQSAILDRLIVLDNVEHHRRPGSLRRGSYWTINRPAILLALGLALVFALCHVHAWQAYLVLAFGSQAFQVHMWAHSSNRPAIAARLQDLGILQSRKHHGRHHTAPYMKNYCTFGNYLNPVLDGIRFWRGLETLIATLGVRMTRGGSARQGF